MKLSEQLREAKAVLTPERWVQRKPENPFEVCMVTAVGHVPFITPDQKGELIWLIGNALRKRMNIYGIVTFNDDPNTTLEMVHEVYNKAIALALEKETLPSVEAHTQLEQQDSLPSS